MLELTNRAVAKRLAVVSAALTPSLSLGADPSNLPSAKGTKLAIKTTGATDLGPGIARSKGVQSHSEWEKCGLAWPHLPNSGPRIPRTASTGAFGVSDGW